MKYYWEMSFYTFDTSVWCEVEITIQASTKFGCARLFLENYTNYWGSTKYTKKQIKEGWEYNYPYKIVLPNVTFKKTK